MRKLLKLVFSLLLPLSCFAQDGIQSDEQTFKEIFESNLKQSEIDIAKERSPYDMEIAFSQQMLGNSIFSNNYFVIPYSEQIESQPMLHFYGGRRVLTYSNLASDIFIGAAYSYKESILEVESKRNGATYRDSVKLHWAPLRIGTKIVYTIPKLQAMSTFARLGIGYEWLNINGSLDGINQTYWVPTYFGSLGANLFSSDPSNIRSWFGGLSLSYGLSRSFSQKQRGSNSQSVELGLRFLL